MDIVEMLSTIWRSKWIVMVTAITAAAVFGFSAFRQQDTYSATALLVVGDLGSGGSIGRSGGEDKLAANFAELADTNEVIANAIDASGLDTSPSQFSGSVSAKTATNSPYINYAATDYTADNAIAKVNAAAQSLVDYVAKQQESILKGRRDDLADQLTEVEAQIAESQKVKDATRVAALDDVRKSLIAQYQQENQQTYTSGGLSVVTLADETFVSSKHPYRNTAIVLVLGAFVGIFIGFGVDSVVRARQQHPEH